MLVKDSACEMPNGIAHLVKLFRKTRISVDAFFSAPEDGWLWDTCYHCHCCFSKFSSRLRNVSIASGNIEPVGDLVGAGSGREEGICTQEMPAVKFTLRKFASWYTS